MDGCCEMTKTSSIAFNNCPLCWRISMLFCCHRPISFLSLLMLLEPIPVVLCWTPWISHQFVTRPHEGPNNRPHTQSPLTNLTELLLSFTFIFWTVGGPLRYKNTHAPTRETSKNICTGDSADLRQCATVTFQLSFYRDYNKKKSLGH